MPVATTSNYTTDSSLHLPLSPPPSPPRSPPLPALRRPRHPLMEDAATASVSNLLNEATARMAGASSRPQASVDHTVQTMRHAARFDVPATPDMSPANQDAHHHPTEAAEAFMRRVFVDWTVSRAFQAEDAGVELVCPGWTGAVAQRLHTPEGAGRKLPLDPSTRALYVHMPRSCDRSALRDHILQLLDTASERVCAGRVVFCLERNLPDLSSLLHGLCYVGGQVATRAGQPDPWTGRQPLASLVLVSVTL